MKARWIKRVAAFAVFAVVAAGVFGLVVMALWNWLVPALFGGRAIDFWQALGLFVLARLLVGGLRRGGHHGHWRGRFAARWAEMSDDERARVRTAMQRRCGHRGRDDAPTPREQPQG
jgi:hypothetical protein